MRRALWVLAVVLVCAARAMVAAQGCGDLQWTQKRGGPQWVSGAAMAFDSERGVTVLFGGAANNTRLNETWEWNGELWSQRPTVGGIPGLWGAAAVYDSLRKRVVVFGGATWTPGLSGDTWEYDGNTWVKVATEGPGFRHYMWQMAYDSKRGRTVLFGGEHRNGRPEIADTWEWDGTRWEMVATGGPSARHGHGMAYDAARERVVMFGGPTTDTWEWDGAVWEQRAIEGPTALGWMRLAYDSERQRVMAFGANLAAPGTPNELWEWDGTVWKQLKTSTMPPRRSVHAMAFDSTRRRLVVYGGFDGAVGLADTWELDLLGEAPTVIREPSRVSEVSEWRTLSFSVGAAGDGPLFFQWRRNGVAVNDSPRMVGAQSQLLQVSLVQESDAGLYDCVVTNACGSVTSGESRVDVEPLPCAVIERQSAAPLGTESEFEISVEVTGGVTGYRWRWNGVGLVDGEGISGAETPTLKLWGTKGAEGGTYDCEIVVPCGTLYTEPVVLSCVPVIVAGPPTKVRNRAGLELSVEVRTGGEQEFRWRKDGIALLNVPGVYSGATTRTLTVLAGDSSVVGLYDCVVSNGCGSVTSAVGEVVGILDGAGPGDVP